MEINKLPALLSVEEMAEILNVEDSSIYELIVINKLPVVKCYDEKISVPKKDFISYLTREDYISS